MNRRLIYLLSILLGIAAFAAVPWIVGVDKVIRQVSEFGWTGLALFVLISSLSLLVPAVGWWILMRAEGVPATLYAAMRANLMGFPMNFVTPSMFLGSEPLKTVFIAQRFGVTKRRVLATIIVAKFQELAGIILAMIVATAILVTRSNVKNEALILSSMIVLTILFVLLLAAFVGRFQPTVKLINLAASLRIARRKLARLRRLAEEMEDLIHAAFTKRIPVFLAAQGITLLSSISIFLRFVVFFHFLRVEVPLTALCLLFVLFNLANGLTPIPGGLGLLEATIETTAVAAGLPRGSGLSFAIVSRIADISLIMLGAWLIVHYGLTRVARGKEPALTAEDKAGLPTPDEVLGPERREGVPGQ